jgi:hypothetical protein
MHLRGTTGCRKVEEAEEVLTQRVEKARHEILFGASQREHTFAEAAVKYVMALERRGSDPERSERDLKALNPFIGVLPLSQVHQDTLEPFF